MRIAFMGTPAISVAVLSELLAAGHDIACVYTRAPAPSGRGKKLRPSPVHEFASVNGLAVRTPKNFKSPEDVDAFAALDLDVAIVVAYGLILPQSILDAPRHGCHNLHASLLPRWRGAAPIQRAIMAGDELTGVQVMQMEAGLDTGPIMLSEAVKISPQETGASLHDRLSGVAAQLAPRALAALARGGLTSTPQAEEGVTYAHKLTAEMAHIDWTQTATEIDRHIRGLSPFPGAWFMAAQTRVKVLMSRPVPSADAKGAAPGRVLQADEKLVIACGDGAVELVTLQRPGKRAQSADEFLRGFDLELGAQLG